LNGRKRKEHLVSVSLLFGGIWVVRNAPEDLDGIGELRPFVSEVVAVAGDFQNRDWSSDCKAQEVPQVADAVENVIEVSGSAEPKMKRRVLRQLGVLTASPPDVDAFELRAEADERALASREGDFDVGELFAAGGDISPDMAAFALACFRLCLDDPRLSPGGQVTSADRDLVELDLLARLKMLPD